jgi:hypothetical protein
MLKKNFAPGSIRMPNQPLLKVCLAHNGGETGFYDIFNDINLKVGLLIDNTFYLGQFLLDSTLNK